MSGKNTYTEKDFEMVRAAIADWEETAAAYGESLEAGARHYAGKEDRCMMCDMSRFDWIDWAQRADGETDESTVMMEPECWDCPIKRTTGHVCFRHVAEQKIDEKIFAVDARGARGLSLRVACWLRTRVLAVMEAANGASGV